jgi:hypothetical protein
VELPPETCRANSLQKCNKLYIVASCWTVTDSKICETCHHTRRKKKGINEQFWAKILCTLY